MNIANIIIVIILTYYTKHIVAMFIPRNRKAFQMFNIKLEEMRKVPVKTLKQQKEFINLKYPKRRKGKFTWKIFFKAVPKVLLMIIFYIVIFRVYLYIFTVWEIKLKVWHAILFLVLFPLLLNLLLEKFNLQKGDLSVFFRGGRK